jgi:hypothetical protein
MVGYSFFGEELGDFTHAMLYTATYWGYINVWSAIPEFSINTDVEKESIDKEVYLERFGFRNSKYLK